jgi:hypothetical protein
MKLSGICEGWQRWPLLRLRPRVLWRQSIMELAILIALLFVIGSLIPHREYITHIR